MVKILKNNLFQNFGHLSSVTLFNLFVPLVTFPYLIKVLGPDLMGLISYYQSILSFFVLIVAFGFNNYALREISINRHSNIKVSEIVSSIMILKISIFILLLFILIILKLLNVLNFEFNILFVLTFWLPINEILFPIWYFQGIENVKVLNFLNFISKAILLSLILITISESTHYLLVPIYYLITGILTAVSAWYIILVKDKIYFVFVPLKVLKFYLKSSTSLFLASLSVNIFAQTNKVIIGKYIGMSDVVYYELADKVVQLLKMPQIILTQVLFPRFSKLYNKRLLKKLMIVSLSFAIIIYIITQFFAKDFVVLYAGVKMMPSIPILRLLIIVIPIVYMSQFTTVLMLLVNKYDRVYFSLIFTTGIIFLAIVFLCLYFNFLSVFSLVYCTLFSELFILVVSYVFVKKFNLV